MVSIHTLSLNASSYKPTVTHTRPLVSGICSKAVSSSLKVVQTDQCPCTLHEKLLHHSHGWNFQCNGNINEGNSTCFCNKLIDKRTALKKKVAGLLHKIVGRSDMRNSGVRSVLLCGCYKSTVKNCGSSYKYDNKTSNRLHITNLKAAEMAEKLNIQLNW